MEETEEKLPNKRFNGVEKSGKLDVFEKVSLKTVE